MTTLNMPSPQASSRNKSNVRPMHVRQDARQVISLLELVFNQHLRGAGHHTISPGFSVKDFLAGKDQLVPGFVYSVDNRIVGNVSLLESRTLNRYLVANVAVHPEFRRRGIAKKMMVEVIRYIQKRGGQEIALQVETENSSAYKLYEQLGFVDMGEVRDWRMNWYSLKTVASKPIVSRNRPDDYGEFKLRPLRSEDARQAYALDKTIFPNELNWPDAPKSDYYKRGLSAWFRWFSNGANHEIWVAENQSKQIVGLGIIENEFGRPYVLKIRIYPDWAPLVERAMVAKLSRRLRYMRSKTITLQQDVKQASIENLLREAGFSLKRNLTVMQLVIDK